MRVLHIVALLSSLTVFACGGAAKKEAKGPESDPWAGYTGKYAESASASASASAKAEKPKAADKAQKVAEKAPEKEEASTHKSTATIHGESVSSIDLDTFADATKTATKGKVVSTKYLVGPKYEQLQIQMKGVAVQVIRPAANPAPDGPSIASPKARNGGVSKLESGYYDADADVVVVVTAAGKPAAQKVLGTIVKH